MLIHENMTICCVEPLHHLKEQGKVGVVGLLHVELHNHVVHAVHLLLQGGKLYFRKWASIPSICAKYELQIIKFIPKSV